MVDGCKHPDCFAPDVACVMGFDDHRTCPHWGAPQGDVVSAPEVDTNVIMPWSSAPFGTTDLAYLAARSKPCIVAAVGPDAAGKSTFLASLYLLLLRRGRVGDTLVAGTFTFQGWESIAHHLRWQGNRPPTFPPHTTAFDQRTPGLLHFSLRQSDGTLQDLLLADAPGEWFRNWAFDRDAPAAAGAQWLSTNADAFLVFIDSEALAGAGRGEARALLKQIVLRLQSERRGRRVAALWTKVDVAVGATIRQQVEDFVSRTLDQPDTFRVSVNPIPPAERPDDQRFLGVFAWLADCAVPLTQHVPPVPTESSDPFLAFRGK